MATTSNDTSGTIISAHFVYKITFGNSITASNSQIKELTLEQGVSTIFQDKNSEESYHVTLHGVKVNKKIYQPTEIECELDFMTVTIDASGNEHSKAPSFEAVTNMFLNREVTLDISHVTRENAINTIETGHSSTVAKSCYVYEVNPQLKREIHGTKMYVKLNIFSMDKLMTLNKYSKAYVARKLGSGILKPESLTFGMMGQTDTPLIRTNIKGLRFLKYNEEMNFTDKNGKVTSATIPSEFIQPYLVQYNESFYDFLVRTANRCGEFLYFENGELILGLPNSGEPLVIDSYEAVTKQDISDDPLTIHAYSRDSMKDGKGEVTKLNQSVISKQSTGFPEDIFPDNTSSNAELANDEYFFPLVKDKFSNFVRETYSDGTKSESAMARIFPQVKTILGNTTDGGAGIGATIAKQSFVAEGITDVKAAFQVSTANTEGNEAYLNPYKDKIEQCDQNKVVQFSSLKEEGWTTIDYYNDIHKYETEQQRQIICIDMGTDYIPVMLGQKIRVDGLKGHYVVIQIQQHSEVAWEHNYDKYDTEASDTCPGRRSQKIYAIPSYQDKNDQEAFIPPVQPVPIIRKAGPQTAFVTANTDPKYQGRVRVAYPWQSLNKALKAQAATVEQNLEEAKAEKERLEQEWTLLPKRLTYQSQRVEELKKYVNATPEERKAMLEKQAQKRAQLEKDIEDLKAQRAIKDSKLTTLENELAAMKQDPNATETEVGMKQFELETYKRNSMAAEIKDIDAKIVAKREEIEKTEREDQEMIDAAKEHDQKKGKSGYKDVEKDNTVIAKRNQIYKQAQKDYKENQQKQSSVKGKIDDLTAQQEKVKEYVDEKVLDMSTPWIRIASPMATPGGGAFFRPREGDEVLINYDNDNIERPYVVGSLFSKNTLTPDEGLYRKPAPEIQWKNISMQMMSPNGHHITFTDPPGGGGFVSNVLSPGIGFYATVIPGLSTLNGMGKNFKDLNGGIHIGDRYGMYEIEMKSHKRSIDIRSPFGTVNIDAFSGITINAPNGNITLKGKNISLEAGNKITMRSGLNIQDPDIGDPAGTGNKVGKTVVGVVGSVLEAGIAPDFIEAAVDFSLIRHVVEVFARPVDGTLLMKSKRYLKLEAGNGNATIRRDRYADKVKQKKETSEEFYKGLVSYIEEINKRVDQYFDGLSELCKDGIKKKAAYRQLDRKYLTATHIQSVFLAVKDLDQLSKDTFGPDFFKEYSYLTQAYSELTEAAKAYGQAIIDTRKYVESFTDMFKDFKVGYFSINSMKSELNKALKDDLDAPGAIKHWKQEAYNSAMIFEEADFEPASMLYKHLNRTVFKRKLLLCFIWHVAHSASNFKNYYMDVEYDLDYIKKTHTFNQEYYWKRQVQIMDHYVQTHKFLRTVIENTYNKLVDKFKSNFAPLDKDIWNDGADGQILFSDQEGTTLNFDGEGLHEESSSNIGTMDHLKRVLMGIK